MSLASFGEKMAKKTFLSDKIQQSWSVHMQAFGPILENAFAEDYASRIHLTAALNNISRREFSQGLEKLKKIQPECKNDADRAAWLFFTGLLLEMAGDKHQSLVLYMQANKLHHRFYMPYLKIAKMAHEDNVYLMAEENYRAAIGCFDGTGLDSQSKTILASAYGNLATCLSMMHRFSEAEEALALSRQLIPNNPSLAAIEAVLCAVKGDDAGAKSQLDILQAYYPPALEKTAEDVDMILNKTHSHFFLIPTEEAPLRDFWQWFAETAESLEAAFEQGGEDAIHGAILDRLSTCFREEIHPAQIDISPEDGMYVLEFQDFFSVSLKAGYETLLSLCPRESLPHWRFTIGH